MEPVSSGMVLFFRGETMRLAVLSTTTLSFPLTRHIVSLTHLLIHSLTHALTSINIIFLYLMYCNCNAFNAGCGLILLGLNMLFMNYYFKYMWNFRCLHISHTDAKRLSQSKQSCDFPLHDMSPSHRSSAKELNGSCSYSILSCPMLYHTPGSCRQCTCILFSN